MKKPRLVDLAVAESHGLKAAIVYGQIQYWAEAKGTHHEGRLWVRFTYEELSHITQIPVRTLKRLVTHMRGVGLLEAMRWPGQGYDPVLWFTLSAKMALTECQNGTGPGAKMALTSIDLVSKKESKKQSEANPKSEAEMKGDGTSTAADVMAKFQGKKVEAVIPDHANAAQCKWYWRLTVPRVFPDLTTLPPFTGKQLGQFTHLVKRSEGRAGTLLRRALNHWPELRTHAGDKGVTLPPLPEIGAILTNLTIVLNWATQEPAKEPELQVPQVKQYVLSQEES